MNTFALLIITVCLIVAKEYFRSVMNKNKLQFFRDECNSVLLNKINKLKSLIESNKEKLEESNSTIENLDKQIDVFKDIKNVKSDELKLLLDNYNLIQKDFETLKNNILNKSQNEDKNSVDYNERDDIEQLRLELSFLEDKLSTSIQRLNDYNKNNQIMIRVVNEVTIKKYNIITDLEDNVITQLDVIRSTNLNLRNLNSNLKDKLNSEIRLNLLEILKNLKEYKKNGFLKNVSNEVNHLNLITIKISMLKLSFTKKIIELYQEGNNNADANNNAIDNKSLSSLKKSINNAYNQKLFEYESTESKIKI